jgi:hypothetical protein
MSISVSGSRPIASNAARGSLMLVSVGAMAAGCK